MPGVYYKPHPGAEGKIEDFFDDFNMFPAFIPIEFFVNGVKVVVAGATTSMNYLAKSGVTCISILDLIRVKDALDKDEWKRKMLLESDNQIKFVQSKEELRECLLNLS